MAEPLVARQTAVARVRALRSAALSGLASEAVPLDGIGGRTVAATVVAARDVPPHDYATMDGYAFAADASAATLAVVGSVAPEDDPPALSAGETVRIATGAPLPARADAVVKREDADVVSPGADGEPRRLRHPGLAAGTHVHPAGTSASEGERLFDEGDRLAPRHAALLRDAAVDAVTVHRPFSVGVIATGTEIHEGRQPDRDSDFFAGLLRRWGHEPTVVGTVPDDEDTVRSTIESAAAEFDAVVTSGGTSVGSGDHVGSVLRDCSDARGLAFGGVALRPGRPVAAATVAGTPVFALPGKPLAAHTALVLVVAPFFVGDRALPTVTATPTVPVGLPSPTHGDAGDAGGAPAVTRDRMEYAIPVVLDGDDAVPLGHESSSLALYGDRFRPGRVSASTRATLADGLALAREPLDPAEPVAVVPYAALE